MELLVKNGADVNARDSIQKTLLQYVGGNLQVKCSNSKLGLTIRKNMPDFCHFDIVCVQYGCLCERTRVYVNTHFGAILSECTQVRFFKIL